MRTFLFYQFMIHFGEQIVMENNSSYHIQMYQLDDSKFLAIKRLATFWVPPCQWPEKSHVNLLKSGNIGLGLGLDLGPSLGGVDHHINQIGALQNEVNFHFAVVWHELCIFFSCYTWAK